MEFVKSVWENDTEYMAIVQDLMENEDFLKLDEITHHHYTTRLTHSIFVSYISYRIAKRMKKCDEVAVARAGLLHDYFHEGREEIEAMDNGSHNFVHPKIAIKNASMVTELSEMEKDIILKHMFLCTRCGVPRYKESYIVTCVDKYCALMEVSQPSRKKLKYFCETWLMKLNFVNA